VVAGLADAARSDQAAVANGQSPEMELPAPQPKADGVPDLATDLTGAL
jgi:hypothetical protein